MMKKLRMTIDIAMTVVLIGLMAYSLIGELTHEILGTVMIVLFVVHHILNRRWFGGLLKSKYRVFRIFQTVLVLLMIVSVFASGIALEYDARCDAKRQRQGKNNWLDTASWCDRHSGIRRICAHPEADWRVSVFTDTFFVLRPYGTDHLFLHGLHGDYGTVRFLRTLSWKSIKVV